jgi:hypothetical protein
MTLTKDVPYSVNHVPLHRLNQVLTRIWMFEETHQARRQLVKSLNKRYPSGVGVVSATLFLIAFIAPNQSVRNLMPPFRKYEMWQMNNKPAPPECACANFVDPENDCRPWRERGSREHHPVCQFERTSSKVFERMVNRPAGKERPDDLTRIRDELSHR